MFASNLYPLRDLMRLVNMWTLLWSTRVFNTFGGAVLRPSDGPDDPLSDEDKGHILKMAEAIEVECRALGLFASSASASRIVRLCKTEGTTLRQFAEFADSEFAGRFSDELSAIPIFAVSPSRASLLKTPNLFGPVVPDAFPKMIDDIENAGKCLAFEQGTACVFHLMRVVELGLRAVGKDLGIPYAPSWESYLKQIKGRIEAKHQTKTPKWKRDEPYFTEILGDIQAVKLSWRNPTIHVRRDYSPDEASVVFDAVKTLMGHVASRETAKKNKKGKPNQ